MLCKRSTIKEFSKFQFFKHLKKAVRKAPLSRKGWGSCRAATEGATNACPLRPANAGHLKVNCPEGAREATLGCPHLANAKQGRLWGTKPAYREIVRFLYSFFRPTAHANTLVLHRKPLPVLAQFPRVFL